MRALSVLRAYKNECGCILRMCNSWQSRLRLMADFLLSRVFIALPANMRNRERTIITTAGIKLSYRLNRGDVQSVREVWLNEVYRLPFASPSGTLLDLGANIGLLSVWMARQGNFSRVVAVEPDPTNAALVAKNLRQNGISGEVLEAAVGPQDGTALFKRSVWSNLGQVGESGAPVRLISVASILREFQLEDVGLAKVDIEGSEQALFLGPSEWLQHTRAIIVEFHPDLVDYPLLTRTVASHGFNYIPAVPSKNMDIFVRTQTLT